MKLKTLFAVAVAAALAIPLVTQAQSDKGASGATTPGSAMDKDKDGSISKEEAKGTRLEKDFDKMDKNNDGKLSRDEMTPGSAAGATGGSTAPKK